MCTNSIVFSYGAVKGRRREAAILVQTSLQYRLHQAGYSTCMKLYDIKNASNSVSQQRIVDAIDENISCPFDFAVGSKLALLMQHSHGHITHVPTCEGHIQLHPQEGAPQGHSLAADIFNISYAKPVVCYDQELQATSPIFFRTYHAYVMFHLRCFPEAHLQR